jgi:hypothetical protein
MNDMPDLDPTAPRAGARVFTMGQVYSVTESIDVVRQMYEEADDDAILEFHVVLYTRNAWEVVRWYPHKRAMMGFLELTDALQEKMEEDQKEAEREAREAAAMGGHVIDLRGMGFGGGFGPHQGGGGLNDRTCPV